MAIHSTAIVDPRAELDTSVEVGPFAVIGPQVHIDAGTTIGAHAVIEGRTRIGKRNRIFQLAALGAIPQDLKYAGEPTELEIGDENQIREFSTLHIGTAAGGGVTRVGNRNLIMANAHVAHDCQVGNEVVLANGVALAGHVEVGDHAILGGLSAVHQFTRIGQHAFLAGGAMVTMDVAPYCMVQGDRAELTGLNTVGLGRNGFSTEAIGHIKSAYKLLFRSGLQMHEALAKVKAEFATVPEVVLLTDFIQASDRGVTR
jgi:UDP-N-acetylglucosamine acyltransferase